MAVEFEIDAARQRACAAPCRSRRVGRTGVEMEALTAVQVGLLTIYDMCKAADRGMVIGDVRAAREARRQVGRLGRRRLADGAATAARC